MIIHLEKDEQLLTHEELYVCNDGDYEPQELVLVYHKDDPTKEAICSYPAYYVKHGIIFNNEE